MHYLNKIKTISPETDTKNLEEQIEKKERAVKSKITKKKKRELSVNPKNSVNNKSTQKNGEKKSTNTVSSDWIKGVCAAVYSTYGDTGKVNILVNSLMQVHSLTGEDVYALYDCSDLYGDSGKLSAIGSLSSKLKKKDLSHAHFSSIIKDLYSDTSKTKGTSMLVPFLKSD